MNRYYYDLHIHSCLSPCADNDMTPNNIAGMAVLAGLDIVALTDHNSAKNCPAFFAAAEKQGVVPVAGMELTTAEDIHAVCLFEALEDALRFDDYLQSQRTLIPNRTDIFGDQLIMNENDEVTGTEPHFLSNATAISIEEAPALVRRFGGICYPAHIDREANGIIATLGTFPETLDCRCAEIRDAENRRSLEEHFPVLKEKRIVISSDAHYLWDIRDKSAYVELNDGPCSGAKIRHELFRWLRGNL